jgi:flagellin-specific chaperone FliS
MVDREITQSKITHVINYVESLMHKLTDDELDELIDELVHLYARYNVYVQSRNGDKPE